MKKLLIVSLLLNAALVFALCRTDPPASAESGAGASCATIANGDVNDDSKLDISDGISILNYLFLGGGAPVPKLVADATCVASLEAELATAQADLAACQAARDACASDLSFCQAARDVCAGNLAACQAALDACGTARDAALADLATCQAGQSACTTALETCEADLLACVQPPATGQTLCYDDAGNVVGCADPAYPGQDGFYKAGCPTAGRFVDNLDGTVTDTCTELIWQKGSAPGTYLWLSALGYCEGLALAGHDDWRLPNLRELRTLYDYSGGEPAIDPIFQAVADSYWTSSTFNADPTHAFTVGFQLDEGNNHEAKVDPFPVRAVRGGLR